MNLTGRQLMIALNQLTEAELDRNFVVDSAVFEAHDYKGEHLVFDLFVTDEETVLGVTKSSMKQPRILRRPK